MIYDFNYIVVNLQNHYVINVSSVIIQSED